jgi:DNA-binding transcriptional LysR family regulator
MTPTPNAMHIAENARVALDLIEGSFALTRAFDPAVAQTIFHLSATESVGFMLVPRLTHKLEQVAPGVRLHIGAAQPSRMREQLEEGEADLVVAYQPQAAGALHTSSLYQQELCVVAASSHPGIRGSLSVDQYLDARHVRYKPTHGHSTIERQIDEAFASRGRTRRIGVSVPSALASAPIVAASNHLATLTRAVAEHAARTNDLQVLPLPFDLGTVSVSMFWHERTHAPSAHVWLRQLIRDLFHDL